MKAVAVCARSSFRSTYRKSLEEPRISDPRTNDRIRVPEVRLIGPNGEQVGVVSIDAALRMAAENDLDLVEVAPQSKPPVAKIMDFGKYKYEAAQKAKEARRNQANTVLKEVRFRLKIDDHDYETKKKQAVSFLNGGDKVKAMILSAVVSSRVPSRVYACFKSLLKTLLNSAPLSTPRPLMVETW